MQENKYIVADTNIWLLNPRWFERFDDSIIVVPQTVIEELDGKKNSPGILGLNARRSIKLIGQVAEQYETDEEVSVILIEDKYRFMLREGGKIGGDILDLSVNDNRIISTALGIQSPDLDKNITLLSNDCNVRTKTSFLYKMFKIKTSELNEGFTNTSDYYNIEYHKVSEEIISKLYSRELAIEDIELRNNSIHTPLYLEYNDEVILATIEKDGKISCLPNGKKNNVYELHNGIKPLNDEQKHLVYMLKNSDIKVLGCIGRSGSGKSLVTVATAMKLLDDGVYSRIKLIKPAVSLGNTVGYLKGDLDQKLDPIKASFRGVFDFMSENLDDLEDKGIIEFSTPEYERGRTYHSTLLVIDECQNLTNVEIKSLITRCSESSKVVLLGDTKQVDSLYLSENYNGLSYVMDKLMGQDFFGGIYMSKSERADFINKVDELL